MLKIKFFGVRGSCPVSGTGYEKYGGNTSCVYLRVILDGGKSQNFIFDLGTGLRPLGESILNSDQFKSEHFYSAACFVTHLHWDHIQGLPFFPILDLEGCQLDIYGPRQVDHTLLTAYSRFMSRPYFPVSIDDFKGSVRLHGLDPGDTVVLAETKIRVAEVPHQGGITLGYRLENHGNSVVYISDHQAPFGWQDGFVEPQILDLCKGADVLIHDAQYSGDEYSKKSDWGHSTVDYAAMIAARSQVKKLLLYHHDPSHKDDDIDRLLEHSRNLVEGPLEIEAAYEGLEISLGQDNISKNHLRSLEDSKKPRLSI